MILPYPKTKDEWWNNVDKAWVDILSILHKFINMGDWEDIDYNPIECPRAVEVEKMKVSRNSQLARYLNAAWQNAPDDINIHNIPSWHVLCDLLSEEAVLHDEKKIKKMP